ncbi:cysteine desulfurase [Desulfohalotomaculum tongense]|uniref:cysteine desulfurase NifS n=1 Tax=Desulforadius tongensis TaxID=1216062 RepID=UPI00195EC73F|nr:cysteine desulfurase NifS [Desulforadius tongensis]MBM7855017.1 cysteine desulfurase [Desulforadius tongensis]
MRRVYFDHAATTPVDPEVAELVMKYMTESYGNPSSVHSFGREVKKPLEYAREQVRKAIGAAHVGEIAFCSGGTEAANMALRGAAYANRQKGNHIITTAVEHHCVLTTCEQLAKEGFEVTVLPVDQYGRISVEDVANALTDQTILVSIMHANNEVGTIMPIAEIGKMLKSQERRIIFHTDAVQSIGKLPVDVDQLNVDMLTFSGHKIYGPKGIGVMYLRRGTWWQPIMYGGGQERRRRPGTENAPAIIGLGRAVEMAVANREEEAEKLTKLRDKLVDRVLSSIPNSRLNGHPTERLPGHASFCFEFVEGESMLLSLDMQGIAISSGSACTSGSLEPSHVLLAMGIPKEIAHGSLRVTLGKYNTEEEVDYFVDNLIPIVERLRKMSPLTGGGACTPCACAGCDQSKK